MNKRQKQKSRAPRSVIQPMTKSKWMWSWSLMSAGSNYVSFFSNKDDNKWTQIAPLLVNDNNSNA